MSAPDNGNPLAINEQAIRSVVAMIELEPRLWNQNFLFRYYLGLGTAFCFAGWACNLAGFDLVAFVEKQEQEKIYFLAQGLLGLNDRQAARLFRFGRFEEPHPSVEQLKVLIHELTGMEFEDSFYLSHFAKRADDPIDFFIL